jgi:competence protein ComEC
VEVVGDASSGGFGRRSLVRLTGAARGTTLQVAWPEGPAPRAGEAATVRLRHRPAARDEWARRRHRAGIAGTVVAKTARTLGWAPTLRGLVGPWRERSLARIRAVRSVGGPLVAGVVLGHREDLEGTPAESDFRTTGLTHLVAVSGSHLVVVAALVSWMLGRVRLPRFAVVLATVGFVGLYVVASGVQASAVRAWLMSAVAAVASTTGRRTDAVAGLAAAVCIAVAIHPPVVFDIGFQLSVAAVAGLVIFARLAEEWLCAALPQWSAALAAPLGLTLTAQATTTPLVASVFGAVSIIAPLANLVTGPLVSAVLVLGLAGVALGGSAPPVSSTLLHAACAFGSAAVGVAGRLAQVPYAAMPFQASGPVLVGSTFLLAATLWARWPAPRAGSARATAAVAAMIVVAVVAGPPASPGTSMVVMDVGQADAILVRDGAQAVLVDAAGDSAALHAALSRNRVRAIDTLIITHAHADHYGGAEGLSGLVRVGRIVTASGATRGLPSGVAMLRAPRVGVVPTETLHCGRIELRVLWPPASETDHASNEASVVLLVQAGGFSALLTGDAEADVLEPLIARGELGDVDVIKVGHHGSAAAVSEEMLASLAPEVAAISVGSGNRFGHPAPSTLAALQNRGVRVLRTDQAGDITFVFDSTGWAVATGSRSASGHACETLTVAHARHDVRVRRGAILSVSSRTETHLPDPERAGLPVEAGAGSASRTRRRGRGPRLQPGDVRGRVGFGGGDRGGMQHAAVRVRPPPRDRQQRRPASQGRGRDARRVRLRSVAHLRARAGRT